MIGHPANQRLTRAYAHALLDEVGEIDASIQVKLLRVLQTREFQRIGETTPREFKGKLIAATNRDLAAEMRARAFPGGSVPTGSARTWS